MLLKDIHMYWETHYLPQNQTADPLERVYLNRWNSSLYPEFQQKLKYAAWIMVVSWPKEEMINHPVIDQIVNSFDIPRHVTTPLSIGLLPIFLVARPLSSDTPLRAEWSSFHHWGIVVRNESEEETLYEIVKATQGIAMSDQRPFSMREAAWTRRQIGYTFLNNGHIKKYGIFHRFPSLSMSETS